MVGHHQNGQLLAIQFDFNKLYSKDCVIIYGINTQSVAAYEDGTVGLVADGCAMFFDKKSRTNL